MHPSKPDFPVIDLHSHLVPAVDDGAATVEEALDSLRSLHSEGVTALVTTPHLMLPRLDTAAAIDRELERHRRAFERLLTAADREEGLPELELGQEIWASDAAMIERVLRRTDVGLAETRYLLVEFGFVLLGTHTDVIEAVLAAGRQIVIAHAERYQYPLAVDPIETAHAWRELGALLQINAGSLTGHYRESNPQSQTLAWRLIDEGLADLIATDHHGSRRVGVSPLEAWQALEAAGRAGQAEMLLREIPEQIWRDEPVIAAGAATRTALSTSRSASRRD